MKALDIIGEFQQAWPQQQFAAGARIIAPDQPTDRAFIIINGHAQAPRRAYGPGDLVNVIEFLALDSYLTPVKAKQKLSAYVMSREQMRDLCMHRDQLTWPLSCMLAIDITKRGASPWGQA